jgi:hypothetical protein
MHKIVLSALVALGLAACAGAATDPQARKLEGELHIKGSARHPTVVLETASHESWELVGVPLDRATALAGRRVQVQGTVVRAAGPGVWLPAIEVRGIPQSSGQ